MFPCLWGVGFCFESRLIVLCCCSNFSLRLKFLSLSLTHCAAFPGSGSLEAVLKSQVHPVVEELARNAIHSRIESLLTADQGKNSDTIEEMVATLEKNFHRQKAFGLEVDNDFEEAKESDGQSGI